MMITFKWSVFRQVESFPRSLSETDCRIPFSRSKVNVKNRGLRLFEVPYRQFRFGYDLAAQSLYRGQIPFHFGFVGSGADGFQLV